MATYKRIYQLALSKVYEAVGGDEDYDTFSPLTLDQLLVECLPYENAVRQLKKQEELTHAPEVEELDDTVLDWDDRITRVALPFGIASVILSDDESRKAESVMMRNEYWATLNNLTPHTFEDVTDGMG